MSMRLGLMSDLYGNAHAVRAVLTDAEIMGVDEWWVLGDLVALGPDPVEVLELLAALPNVRCIGGNTERYVLTGDRPYPDFPDVRRDPGLLERLVTIAASFGWTRGAITQAGWRHWLAGLPTELRLTLPDGTALLAIHASPGSDDGPGIDTRIDDESLFALLAGCGADLVIGGHTHDVTDRQVGAIRAVNLGSVSNSHRADRCATYAIIDATEHHHQVMPRIVDYDHDAFVRRLDEVGHPSADYLQQFQIVRDST